MCQDCTIFEKFDCTFVNWMDLLRKENNIDKIQPLSLGKRLSQERRLRHLSQEALAELIKNAPKFFFGGFRGHAESERSHIEHAVSNSGMPQPVQTEQDAPMVCCAGWCHAD